MILSVKEKWKHETEKITMSVHRGQRMHVSCIIAEFQDSETPEFDS